MKRKSILVLLMALALILPGGLLPADSVSADNGNGHLVSVTVTEGTNIAVSVSPDHNTIVMDLQGVLWTLPINGGEATRITDNFADPSFPDWSPDGERIVFQSYMDGNFHIWSMKPDGSDMRQHTSDPYDDREPSISPDGSRIAFSSDRGGEGSYDVWVVDLETETLARWTDSPAEESHPTWSPDGTEIAYVSGGNIEAIDESGNRRTLVEGEGRISAPSWSPDGERIAYISEGDLMISGEPMTHGENVFSFAVEWLSPNEIVYTADGQIKSRNLDQDHSEAIPFRAQIDIELPDYEYKEHDFD